MGIHDNIYKGMACVGMVTVSGAGGKKRLVPRFDIKNFCDESVSSRGTDAFDWGCKSPECFQLGISILANEYGDDFAIRHGEAFTKAYLCKLDEEENWEMSSDDLDKITFRISAGMN